MILLGVFTVGSAAFWFMRDLGYISGYFAGMFGFREGSLVVNINTASVADLETLSGIGPALAALIIADRPYTSVENLARVRGIGPGLVRSLGPLLAVEGETRKVESADHCRNVPGMGS